MTQTISALDQITAALATDRTETARRLCQKALAGEQRPHQRNELSLLLHRVCRQLADPAACRAALETFSPENDEERFTRLLLEAEDTHTSSYYPVYRLSAEAKAGLSMDEYHAKYQALATTLFTEATALAKDQPQLRSRLRESLQQCNRAALARDWGLVDPEARTAAPPAVAPARGCGTVAGTLRFPDGQPVAGAAVTLGLKLEIKFERDAATEIYTDSEGDFVHYGPQRVLTATTDDAGRFTIGLVPADTHEFLAVTLDPLAFDIPTRFLAQEITVAAGQEVRLDLTVGEWASAPAEQIESPFPDRLERNGTVYRRVGVQNFRNPFYYSFPRQAVRVPLAPGVTTNPERLLVLVDVATATPFQVIGKELLLFTDLPQQTRKVIAVYEVEESVSEPVVAVPVDKQPDTKESLPVAAKDTSHDAPSPAPKQLGARLSPAAGERPVLLRAGTGEGAGGLSCVPAKVRRQADYGPQDASSGPPSPWLPAPDPGGQTAVIDTGRACFRIPWGDGADALPPLLAVRGEDGVWRGQGRFRLPAGVAIRERRTRIMETGPLLLEWETAYVLSNDARYLIRFTAHRDEPYLLAHEISPEIAEASFEFSLAEFSGGRGYMHWCPHRTAAHWSTLEREDRELARLQESVSWWNPVQGFAYAMTADGLEQRDFIGVFTIRRGEWVDRKFDQLTRGPIDAEGRPNRELDWPAPEMVGSTISMITAHTAATGDAWFQFGFFNGERRWGILVSTIERNDCFLKELGTVQHKNSSPRLDEFKDWRLDEPDHGVRPSVLARRQELRALRRKRQSPVFAPVWDKIASNRAKLENWFSYNSGGRSGLEGIATGGATGGPVMGLYFAVENEPRAAWLMKRELVNVAGVYAKAILHGRDISDAYSPVGSRPITHWVENYDLIAASGVFRPDEERLVRSFFLLMGHMFREPDFMNWQYNSRNANFESDRVDVVGAVGLAFWGNPDAEAFVRHAASLMERALDTYCTPGSGRWYENPPCYYLQSLKCRSNLAFHLAQHGVFDPTRLPRFKEFLRWAILLVMPPAPRKYEVMRDGCAAADWESLDKIRRIPPIGDHAYIGRSFPEHFALMAKLYRDRDPAFADELLWAYQAGGLSGEAYANFPVLFASLDEQDLRPAAPVVLASRRLEGFGAVLRGHFNQPNEFYLLLKQGPGGYRYHRTEGSILLFADGKPLIYDGGEAGETWRHSTLSFYDIHMPLAAGHVERFASFPGLDFVEGVHPCVIKPGEPIQLNDQCDHPLVEVAWERFAEPHPANVRSVFWVKDDYVVLHDGLHVDPSIPCHWHLQVVADGETGDSQRGYVFRGRFGTDLQVLLPGQRVTAESCESVPHLDHLPPAQCFAMRHLRVTADRPEFYLAVLRPLPNHRKPVQAALALGGVGITGEGIDDRLFFRREGLVVDDPYTRFTGRYAAVLRRPGSLQLCLLDGRLLEAGGARIESDGPAVFVGVQGSRAELVAEGHGRVRLRVGTRETEVELDHGRCAIHIDL